MNPISCLDAWQDGENVWLSNYDYNALIRWNMDSGEAEIMGLFPREPEDAGRLHRRVFCVGKKLYFFFLFYKIPGPRGSRGNWMAASVLKTKEIAGCLNP